MQLFTTTFIAALATLAAAWPREARQSAPVTYPHSGTTWIGGQHHNVTWNVGEVPDLPGARILLAKSGTIVSSGAGSFASPLAANFDVSKGRVEVQVPKVSGTSSQYQVFLTFVEASEKFKIQK